MSLGKELILYIYRYILKDNKPLKLGPTRSVLLAVYKATHSERIKRPHSFN